MSGEGSPRSIYNSIFLLPFRDAFFFRDILFAARDLRNGSNSPSECQNKTENPLSAHYSCRKPTAPIFLFGASIKKKAEQTGEKREGNPKASFSLNKVYLAFAGMLTGGPCGIETYGALLIRVLFEAAQYSDLSLSSRCKAYEYS